MYFLKPNGCVCNVLVPYLVSCIMVELILLIKALSIKLHISKLPPLEVAIAINPGLESCFNLTLETVIDNWAPSDDTKRCLRHIPANSKIDLLFH